MSDRRLAIGVIGLDQLSKFFIRRSNIPFVENNTLPFGINLPGVFNLFAVAAALALFVFLSRKYFRDSRAFALITGGALSNFADRAAKGTVTDFINLGVGIINLADIAVYVGIALLVIQNLKQKNQK